jgi:cyanophycin synthetase
LAAAARDATTPASSSTARRGTPLIQIVRQKQLKGPNLYTDGTVVLATLRGSKMLAQLALKAPAGPGSLAGCEAHPGGLEIVQLVADARAKLGKAATGWDLVLAIAESAQADHALVPERGRVLREAGEEVDVLVPADSLQVGLAALKLGCSLVLALWGGGGERGFAAANNVREQYSRAARLHSPDMSTLALARRAIANDIPVYFPGPTRTMIQMGQGKYARLATETVVDPQSTHALRLARDKWATLSRLRMFGLPALPSGMVNTADNAVTVWHKIGAPVVLKPVSGGKGLGISLNLNDEKQIRRAFAIAARYGQQVLVEQYATGDDHRITVIDGKMVAAAKRVAATVTGDGKHTVRRLLDILNADPRRGLPFEKWMERVQIDERLEMLLAQQGLSLDAVPARGRVVKASLAANISQGGTSVDVTDIVHPDNRLAIELAARACHALVAGVDFFSPDISKSWRDGAGWILEVNTSPGFRPHWIANPADDLMLPVLRVAFPEGAPTRVPSAGITGSVGKTTTCQLLAHLARTAGRHPGLNTTQGTWSGDAQFKIGDFAGGMHAAELATDPAVDFIVTELARGGLYKGGMGIDALDVAAVLNLHRNHIGLEGAETREQLAKVKAIPVRRARKWVFLYADDPLVLAMRDEMAPGVQLGLVSPNPESKALAKHRKAGGCTVTLEGTGKAARIVVRQGETVELDVKLATIPAESGQSRAIAENAMFAAAMALKLGLTRDEVAAGLSSFASTPQQNPGRHNRIDGLPFDLLVTWFEGVPAFEELLGRLDREKVQGKRHIYLVVAGNRGDDWIRDTAHKAAGHFDHYWCSELPNPRGRAPGEISELTAQGLREAGVPDDAITCLGGGNIAVGPVLAQIEPGEHMTMMVYDTAAMLRDIETFREGLEKA